MVGKSVKLSSKDVTPVKIISRGLVSDSVGRNNIKVCRNKGDLSDITDAEVAGYLNNKEEFILKKRAWELMNPEYQGKRRKVTTEKKKNPANKTAPSKAFATRPESNAETENKKRPSLEINYDALDKLFADDNSPKRANLEKAVGVGDQVEYSNQGSEESLLKPQGPEEEEEVEEEEEEEESLLKPQGPEEEEEEEEEAWSEDYSNEDAYRGDEECYGNNDLEFEDEVEDDYDEGIIW